MLSATAFRRSRTSIGAVQAIVLDRRTGLADGFADPRRDGREHRPLVSLTRCSEVVHGCVLPRVFLHAGQERRIALGHPWAYSNEIRMDAETKALPAGTIATLHRSDGKPLGVGSFNPHTLIAFRLFDRDVGMTIDEAFFTRRLRRAIRLRDRLFAEPYYRLAHAEADGLPGLVCDRFGDVLVVQMNTAGMQTLTPPILACLDTLLESARHRAPQ